MNKGHQLGKIAELYAQQFFVRKGYQLLAKNYRYRKAEVDLIVRIVHAPMTITAIRVHL